MNTTYAKESLGTDVLLYFMCGIDSEWEKEIKSVRPDVDVLWLGKHVANVISDKEPVTNIVSEIEKFYKQTGGILPCIMYCRSELMNPKFKKTTNKEKQK